jgi:DNA-binding transcriptional ArsR family regulator
MHALATPSRVLILGRLRDGHATVIELAECAGLEQSAASHQLRVLRDLGLVTCERDGRHMVYDLHDDHVVELIDQAVHHTTHARLGLTRDHSPHS